MTQQNVEQTAAPVRNLERAWEKKFQSYGEAALIQKTAKSIIGDLAKAKIFRRNDGTFDLVLYRKLGTAEAQKKQVAEIVEKAKRPAKHGLKSKDRKRTQKK